MNQLLRWMPDPVRRSARTCLYFYQHQVARVHPCPVLIGGNQKSGTTAIAALLAKATGSRFSNDPFWHALRNDARAFLFTDLLERRVTLDDFVQRHRAYFAAEIIKDPDFIFLFPELQSRFPESPQVFILRDPRQNIRSILNRLRLPGDLDRMGPEHDALLAGRAGWRAVLDGRGLGITEGNYVSRLAQRWNLGVERYLQQQSQIHLVRYEDFMADKTGCISGLADRLGLNVVADITGEVNRQFQPRGDRSVALEDFFGEKNLGLINSICASGIAQFGYG